VEVKKKLGKKKGFSFKHKKAKKRALAKGKQRKATQTAMNVIPQQPTQTSTEQNAMNTIDPNALPLSVGSIEPPPPPPPPMHPPIYEGVNSDSGKVIGIGIAVLAALAATSVAIRRRRQRQGLIFN
jgi:hypothetical protein